MCFRMKRYDKGYFPGVGFYVILFFLASCSSAKQYYNGTDEIILPPRVQAPVFTLYAIGDAGLRNAQSDAIVARVPNGECP